MSPAKTTAATFGPPTPVVAVPEHIRALARQLLGTDRGADAWLTDKNPELDGRAPTELIAAGQADVIERFLEGNLAGNYG